MILLLFFAMPVRFMRREKKIKAKKKHVVGAQPPLVWRRTPHHHDRGKKTTSP